MRKWLVMRKRSWSVQFSLDDWFDFRSDAVRYIAKEQARKDPETFRLFPVNLDDVEPVDILPPAAPSDATEDSVPDEPELAAAQGPGI